AEWRAGLKQPRGEAEWRAHASDELARLKPQPGEELALAERRTTMMQAEKVAGALRDAHDAGAGTPAPGPNLAAAIRRLERRQAQAPALLEPVVRALDAAFSAVEDARG